MLKQKKKFNVFFIPLSYSSISKTTIAEVHNKRHICVSDVWISNNIRLSFSYTENAVNNCRERERYRPHIHNFTRTYTLVFERENWQWTTHWLERWMCTCYSIGLEGKEGFYITNINIPLEMHMCFLSLRLRDDDCFLAQWTHGLLIMCMAGKSLIISKNHRKTQVNSFCWKLTSSYIRWAYFGITNISTDFTSGHAMWSNSWISYNSGKMCFTKYMY